MPFERACRLEWPSCKVHGVRWQCRKTTRLCSARTTYAVLSRAYDGEAARHGRFSLASGSPDSARNLVTMGLVPLHRLEL